MPYRFLSNSLHLTADRAVDYFKTHHGAKTFEFEEPLASDIAYRPTIQAMMTDYHCLCVEVTDSPYPRGALNEFVLDCMRRSLPVRLYLAIPAGLADATFRQNIEFANKWSIGIIQVGEATSEVLAPPTSLSLAAVRTIDRSKYPRKYRQAVSDAVSAFLSGNPAKGCSLLYDEIETLSRKVTKKTYDKGFWKANQTPSGNVDTGAWANVLDQLLDKLNFQSCRASCPVLSRELIAQIRGITAHRNESGHKPKSKSKLINRDRRLRTRFEHAADLLLDLTDAAKPLRV